MEKVSECVSGECRSHFQKIKPGKVKVSERECVCASSICVIRVL